MGLIYSQTLVNSSDSGLYFLLKKYGIFFQVILAIIMIIALI